MIKEYKSKKNTSIVRAVQYDGSKESIDAILLLSKETSMPFFDPSVCDDDKCLILKYSRNGREPTIGLCLDGYMVAEDEDSYLCSDDRFEDQFEEVESADRFWNKRGDSDPSEVIESMSKGVHGSQVIAMSEATFAAINSNIKILPLPVFAKILESEEVGQILVFMELEYDELIVHVKWNSSDLEGAVRMKFDTEDEQVDAFNKCSVESAEKLILKTHADLGANIDYTDPSAVLGCRAIGQPQQAVLAVLSPGESKTALQIIQQSGGALTRNAISNVLEDLGEDGLVTSVWEAVYQARGGGAFRFSITKEGEKLKKELEQ